MLGLEKPFPCEGVWSRWISLNAGISQLSSWFQGSGLRLSKPHWLILSGHVERVGIGGWHFFPPPGSKSTLSSSVLGLLIYMDQLS